MNRIIIYDVLEKSVIKNILKNKLKMSERFIRKLKLNNKILLNNSYVKTSDVASAGDRLTIDLNFEEESENIDAVKMDLDILYEDDWMIVINKPANMVVHPSILHRADSLANGVKYYLNSKNENIKMRFVNRLDRDTTGIVIFAKSEYIQECLSYQMQLGECVKEYRAVVEGALEGKGEINLPIRRQEGSIMLREVGTGGEKAITHYETEKVVNGNSFLKIILETGRTHQIRVHMKTINHPIVGDDLYGNKSALIGRQALHAYRIKFIHPVARQMIEFVAPIPNDMKLLI